MLHLGSFSFSRRHRTSLGRRGALGGGGAQLDMGWLVEEVSTQPASSRVMTVQPLSKTTL